MKTKKLTIEYHLVHSCNLRCAGCSHYSSLLDKLTYPKLEDIIDDLTLLKNKIGDNLTTLRLLGGEPLLHPQICECLTEIRNIFPKTSMVLVTNGILLKKMSNEFYDICRTSRVELIITNYRIIDISTAMNKLKELGIKAKVYKNSDKNFIWHYKHIRLTEGKIDCLTNCTFKNSCNNYRNGKIYLCPHIAYIDFFNDYFGTTIKLDDTDYISLDEINSFDELVEKINSAKPNFCFNYCNYYDETHPEKGKWHTTKKDINEFCLMSKCEK